MDRRFERLVVLRDERAVHQRAADGVRDKIYKIIRSMPLDSDKTAIQRASGVSRPTVYQLLQEGNPINTELELITTAGAVRDYIARIRDALSSPDDVIAAFIAEAEYSVGNRRTDGADWYWPDLEQALDCARSWQESRTAERMDALLDALDDAVQTVEEDERDAQSSN
jgi:hypothetical protein